MTTLREHAVENLQIIIPEFRRKLLFPTPMKPARFDLVVADPNYYAGMVTKTLHVIFSFLTHVVDKRFIGRIKAAAKHEILPDENSHFIAKLIKIIALVNAAA